MTRGTTRKLQTMNNSGVNTTSLRKSVADMKRNTRRLAKAAKRFESMKGTRKEMQQSRFMLHRIKQSQYNLRQEIAKQQAAANAAEKAAANAMKAQKAAAQAAAASEKEAAAAAAKASKLAAKAAKEAAKASANSNANALLATLLNKSRSNQEAEFNIAGFGHQALQNALARLPKEEANAVEELIPVSATQLSSLKKKAAALTNAANAVAEQDPELGLSPRTHAELNMLSGRLQHVNLKNTNWGGESGPSYGSTGVGTPVNKSYAKNLVRGYERPNQEEYP
jgi:colicin import membrane protein